MQALLIGGAVVLVLALVALAIIVNLSKKVGESGQRDEQQKREEVRRQDADEVLAEGVADERAWIERQIELVREAANERDLALTRARLRELQRKLGRGPWAAAIKRPDAP